MTRPTSEDLPGQLAAARQALEAQGARLEYLQGLVNHLAGRTNQLAPVVIRLSMTRDGHEVTAVGYRSVCLLCHARSPDRVDRFEQLGTLTVDHDSSCLIATARRLLQTGLFEPGPLRSQRAEVVKALARLWVSGSKEIGLRDDTEAAFAQAMGIRTAVETEDHARLLWVELGEILGPEYPEFLEATQERMRALMSARSSIERLFGLLHPASRSS